MDGGAVPNTFPMNGYLTVTSWNQGALVRFATPVDECRGPSDKPAIGCLPSGKTIRIPRAEQGKEIIHAGR